MPTWVGTAGVLMVEPTRGEMLTELYSQELSVAVVVDALVAEGWSAMPMFACVIEQGDNCSVLLRGTFRVTTSSGEHIDGRGVSTWTERILPSGESVMSIQWADDASDGDVYPIVGGVVLASSISLAGASLSKAVQPVSLDADVPQVLAPEPSPVAPPQEPKPVIETPPFGPAAPTLAEPEDHMFDEMFGATIQRRAEDAAVRDHEEPLPQGPGLINEVPLGDHDGRTRTPAQLAKLRETSSIEPSGGSSGGFVLEVSDGQKVDVEWSVNVGRNPRVSLNSGREFPTLVFVDDPYVSSTHVELRRAGAQVVATDLSTNGTSLEHQGAVTLLSPHTATPVPDGAVLHLSDQVRLTVRCEDRA